MGRLAEAEGESKIYQDLRMKLFIDPVELKKQYAREPRVAEVADERVGRRPELLPLKHPDVKPRVIQHFEPWMALSFHRGQHRRRYRAHQPESARGVLRQDSGAARARTPSEELLRGAVADRTAPPSRRRTPPVTTRCC